MLSQLIKTIRMSYICLKYTNRLKSIQDYQYNRLNKEKFDFTQESLNYLKISTKTILPNNRNPFKDDEQYLFIINHRSLLDIIIIENFLSFFKKESTNNFWIAKEELKKMFIFGSFFREVKSNIFIDRESSSSTKKMLKDIKHIIQKGNSNICIFPEGTRNKTNKKILEFKGGAELISKMNKLKVVNIYINANTANLLKDRISNREIEIFIDTPHNDYDNIENLYKNFINKI